MGGAGSLELIVKEKTKRIYQLYQLMSQKKSATVTVRSNEIVNEVSMAENGDLSIA